MNGSSLLTLYRSLTRHRLYAVLNVGGLALGIAVFLVLFLFVQFERGYDRVLPGWDKVWLVSTQYNIPGFPDVNLVGASDLLQQMQSDFPGLVGTRMDQRQDVALKNGSTVTNEDVAEVDPNFFVLFPYPVVAGDPAQALSHPDAAVVTEGLARKYLGEQSPIGKTITMTIDGQTRAYRVAAVLHDMPADMTYKSDIFVPLLAPSSDGAEQSMTIFLRLSDAAGAAALERQMPAFIDRHPNGDMVKGARLSDILTIHFRPLGSVHLVEARDKAVVATLGLVGLLTLLIASVNYVNLATARAGLRAREVAVRKVLGGTRASLVAQFLIEAIATVAVATLVALAIAEVALPFVNTIGGTSLAIRYVGQHSILLPLVALIVIVGGLAGLYPAFVLSRFRPAAVLASAQTPGGGKAGARLRQALVVAQFAIAIAFTIGTAVLVAQTAHLRAADLGFQRDGLILVPSFLADNLDEAQRADLLRAFTAIPGVSSVGRSRAAPSGGSFNIATYSDDKGGPKITVQNIDTGPGFFQVYHARLLAGRLFDTAYAADDNSELSKEGFPKTPNNVIINATAVKSFGFASPADAAGKFAKLGGAKHPPKIIGVVADMRFLSPREPIQPILYDFNAKATEGMMPAIRVTPENIAAVRARMEQAWRRIAPGVPFRAETANELLYEHFYKEDAQRSRLFTIGAALAVLIGCIGLYGLAAFDTARRVKEIGIRKTLGASTRDIMRLLIGQFLRPVFLANILAWPIAFFAMRKWLSGFDDRVALSPLFFLGASLIAVLIACLTIFGQAWRVARAEPARALRYE